MRRSRWAENAERTNGGLLPGVQPIFYGTVIF